MKFLFKRLPGLAIFLLAWLVRLLAWTQRVKRVGSHDLYNLKDSKPVVFLIWHNRLLLIPALLTKRFRTKFTVLTSASRDGGYLADYLGHLGVETVRGSSSRGGARALVMLKKRLAAGNSVGWGPDGPRGPRYVVQDGAIWLASKAGVPIVPASYNTRHHLELKSWDRTQIPLPFTSGEYIVGDPIDIPPKLDEKTLAEANAKVTAALMAITRWDHPDDAD